MIHTGPVVARNKDGRLVLFATTWSVAQPHTPGSEIRYANGLFHPGADNPGRRLGGLGH
jgi:hypothetical protein